MLCTNPVFHPIFILSWIFCRKRNSVKLEKLQKRALSFIFSDYTSPYRELLKHVHFRSLSALRIRYLAIEMYKCVQGLNPPYLNVPFKSKDTRCNFRDSNRLQQPEFQTVRYGLKSFRYHGLKLWNALPAEVKKSQNLHHFKKNVTQWCASAKCDVFIIQWYTWYICIYIMYIFVYIYYAIWNLSHHFIGFICSSVYHLITCNFYWTISLYVRFMMWNVLSTSNFIIILKPFSFFDVYFRKIS